MPRKTTEAPKQAANLKDMGQRFIAAWNKAASMHSPPHPGHTLRDDVLPAMGLSATLAAAQLDVSRGTLSRVLNGRAAISPEMALRIEAWLSKERGGDARVWLAQQSAYDLWQVQRQSKALPIKRRKYSAADLVAMQGKKPPALDAEWGKMAAMGCESPP
jgi:antitoxin HigA-1